MFKRGLILVSICFLIGCASSKKIETETKEKVEVITKITEKKLDTNLIIPGEKVSLFIPIEKVLKAKNKGFVEPKIYKEKKGRASVTVKIDSTGINATSNCDSIAQRLHYYERELTEFRKQNTVTNTKVTEKKGFTFFQLILYLLVTAAVCFVAGYVTKSLKII